jgi:hypothetical protein
LALYRELREKVSIAGSLYTLSRLAVGQSEYERAEALLEEGLAIAREIGDQWRIAQMFCLLGLMACRQGNNDRAAALYQESLALERQGGHWSVVSCLAGLGEVAVARGQLARAARLFGASAALRETLVVPPGDYGPVGGLSEESVAKLRGVMGEAAFPAAWAEGRAMSREQALTYAMEGANG